MIKHLFAIITLILASLSIQAESWIPVGYAKVYRYSDTYNSLMLEQSSDDPTIFRLQLLHGQYSFKFDDYFYIHTSNPDKVYMPSVSKDYVMSDYRQSITVSQRVPENGYDTEYYAKISGNDINFMPESIKHINYRYYDGFSYDGYVSLQKITFPSGVLGSVPVVPVDPSNPDEPIDEDASGVFLGMTAFNQDIKSMPIGLLTPENKSEYQNFVNSLEPKIGTLLYYGTDLAIQALVLPTYPHNLGNIVLITFTDGLDQGSIAYKRELGNSQNYAKYLAQTIGSTIKQNCQLVAYSIGLKGSDVVDDEMFMINLKSLSSFDEYASTVADMAGVDDMLRKIVNQLSWTSTKKVISVTIPMPSDGERIRFTLDASSEANASTTWIEGVFSLNNMTLDNITYGGMTCASGTTVTAKQTGIFVEFTFTDCRDTAGRPLETQVADLDHWYYIPSRDFWQHNVEIDNDEQVKIEEIHTSTAVMFAIDCSSSLNDKFAELKNVVNSFIDRLATGKADESSISEIYIDDNDAPIEYYNLQGIRVVNPSHGLYIMRQGHRTSKVIL